MILKACILVFIGLWYQVQADDLDNDFNVDVPSYDEYSEWEPLPTFLFENNSTKNRTEDLSDVTLRPEEQQEISKENKIKNVFFMLEEIKERLEVINEPLKVLEKLLNERNEPLSEENELRRALKEPLPDVVLPEEITDDGKDVQERECLKNDVIVENEPKEAHFAGPVKAKGTVSVGANYGYESSYPTSYPYYPSYFYGPYYYPLPYYYPYFPPSYPQDLYLEYLKNYFRTPFKPNRKIETLELPDLPDCDTEESGIASQWQTQETGITNHWQVPGENEPKAGKPFGGFVPACGRISIAAHY